MRQHPPEKRPRLDVLVNLAIATFTTGLALFLVDWMIGRGLFGLPPVTADYYLDVHETAKRAAIARGEPFDTRSVVEVIRTEQARGRRAFYALSPTYYALPNGSRIVVDGKAVVPIGIVPHASSYYCNESGIWTEFKSDRYGLRNPDSVWELASIDILMIGDSFAWGACIAEEASIAGRIRASFPATINAAIGANGPLTELAALREIVPARKPKHVLWLFFENDFDDLKREKSVAILPNYLDRSFQQGLLELAPQTGPIIEELANGYLEAIEKTRAGHRRSNEAFYTLPHLRRLYGFLAKPQPSPAAADLDYFRSIMLVAKAEAEKHGGALTFVYIPDCPSTEYHRETWRARLLSQLKELDIPVIDADPIIKAMQAKGVPAHFYCPASHLNPTGAAAIAEAILQSLR